MTEIEQTVECPRCSSGHVVKLGNTYGKQGDKRQRYGCVDCQENGRSWTFPEFYKRQFDNGDIHTCPQCEAKGIDSNMIRRGIYKWGIHKGEQRFICTNDNCGHIEFEPISKEPEKNSKPKEDEDEEGEEEGERKYIYDPTDEHEIEARRILERADQIERERIEQLKVDKVSKNKILRKKKIELLKKQNRLLEE